MLLHKLRIRRLWTRKAAKSAIGLPFIWKIIGIGSDLEFLGRIGAKVFGEGVMGTIIGWILSWWVSIPLFAIAIWWLASLYFRPSKKQPYDVRCWDAVQFIKNDTLFGRGKTDELILNYIKRAALKGLIRIWAKSSNEEYFKTIPVVQLSGAQIDCEPGGSGGQIYDRKKTRLYSEYLYFDPRFSIEELNSVFRNKGILTRIMEYWWKRQRQKVEQKEAILRDD